MDLKIEWMGNIMEATPLPSFREFVVYIKMTLLDIPEYFSLSYVDAEGKERIVSDENKYEEALSLSKMKEVVFSILETSPRSSSKNPRVSIRALQDPYGAQLSASLSPIHEMGKDSNAEIKKEIKETKLRVFIEEDSIEFSEDEKWEDFTKEDSSEETKAVESSNENSKIGNTKKTVPCVGCDGKGTDNNAKACKKCFGTGEINRHIYEYFQKKLKEASQIDHETSREDSKILSALESSIYDKPEPKCIQCKRIIESGNPIFVCPICDSSFCEDCDEEVDHVHSKLKFWVKGRRKVYKANIKVLDKEDELVEPGVKVTRVVTVKNVGRVKFPASTMLASIDNKVCVQIGELDKGQHFDVYLNFETPLNPGKHEYWYKLVINWRVIDNPVLISINVKKKDTGSKMLEESELTLERVEVYAMLSAAFKEKHHLKAIFDIFKQCEYDLDKTIAVLSKK